MKNSKKYFVALIREICLESGIDIETFSYDWILRLSRNGKVAHIFGCKFEINSATSQLICTDKCAASDILLFTGVPAVKHHFFRSTKNINYVGISGNWERMLKLLHEFEKVVCKANEGSFGSDVYLASNPFELERAAQEVFSRSRTIAICPFYEVDKEYRVVVLDNQAKLIFSKNIPFLVGDGASTLRELLLSYAQMHTDFPLNLKEFDGDAAILEQGKKYPLNWKHNLAQGAYPEIVQDESLVARLSELAIRAARAVNIRFASVDLVKVENDFMVMEINSGVLLDHLSYRPVAKKIYQEAIEKMLA